MKIQDVYEFKNLLSDLFEINLFQYKASQTDRRILEFMKRYKYQTFDTFYSDLIKSEVLQKALWKKLTITVSEFFRDREQFEEFEKLIIPLLELKREKGFKIWSAGCSRGYEIYTIALILHKYNLLSYATLKATDICEYTLQDGIKGTYKTNELETVPEEYRVYFKKTNDQTVQIIPEILNRVEFNKLDLLKNPFDNQYDVIVCRNVLIYFTYEAKLSLYHKFYESLSPNGVFFVGISERILHYKDFNYTVLSKYMYQKGD
jgi:chemotaxis protein methyltransferase CheR